jgi:CRISPR/Cas system CSM-associated protein Csm3 (group 7 of RAMP superfamily)
MNTIIYKIEFFSYWHVSSGLSGSTYADLLVNKTKDGLPFLPGKTLKGLLREAAETINKLHPTVVKVDFINDVFGERRQSNDQNTQEKYREEAKSFFSSGTLSGELQTQITNESKPYLFNVLSSTKIGENGQAENHSLRQIEVSIPLVLYASIEEFPNEDNYLEQLDHCMNFTKRMGLSRSRGLGRCRFSMLKNN